MYVVFNTEWEKVADGDDRDKVTRSVKALGEGEYVLAKLLQPLTVRPPKRELDNVLELGPSYNPRKSKKTVTSE